jgi:protein gp37
MVFVNSMSDLFHARVPDAFVRQVFAVMANTPQHTYQVLTKRPRRMAHLANTLTWPANVWAGVSVGAPEQAHRIDALRQVPAAVRFVSAEPLLADLAGINLAGVHWLIVGGESGPNARPMHLDWARHLITAANTQRTAVFVKQLGARFAAGRGKGNDPNTWPTDLRVRTYPTPPTTH